MLTGVHDTNQVLIISTFKRSWVLLAHMKSWVSVSQTIERLFLGSFLSSRCWTNSVTSWSRVEKLIYLFWSGKVGYFMKSSPSGPRENERGRDGNRCSQVGLGAPSLKLLRPCGCKQVIYLLWASALPCKLGLILFTSRVDVKNQMKDFAKWYVK